MKALQIRIPRGDEVVAMVPHSPDTTAQEYLVVTKQGRVYLIAEGFNGKWTYGQVEVDDE